MDARCQSQSTDADRKIVVIRYESKKEIAAGQDASPFLKFELLMPCLASEITEPPAVSRSIASTIEPERPRHRQPDQSSGGPEPSPVVA